MELPGVVSEAITTPNQTRSVSLHPAGWSCCQQVQHLQRGNKTEILLLCIVLSHFVSKKKKKKKER